MTAFAVHLMRHGAPVLPGRLLGRTDCDVTAEGIAACAAQAEQLGFERLVASHLRRSRRSAEAIGSPLIDPRWRELDFGDWDGLAAADVAPAAIGAFWTDPDECPPPRGERWSTLVARVAEAIEELAPVPTLVVTHAGAMRAALAHLCGMPHGAAWAFDLPYAAVLSFSLWDGSPRRAQVTGLRT